jgi:hypothetical protein
MTDNTLAMTPQQYAAQSATEQLVELAERYRADNPPTDGSLTAEEAGQRLVELKARYDTQQRDANPDGMPQPSKTTTWPQLATGDKLDLIAKLQDLGVPTEGIKAIVDGKAYSKADVEMARDWKSEVMHNPELARKLLAGDRELTRIFVGMSHLIATAAEAA